MKQRIVVVLLFLGLIFGAGDKANSQTVFDWMGTAPDANWQRGSDGARWWNNTTANGYWDAPDATSVLRFNNNHQLTMNNNVAAGFSVHELRFGSANTSVRTLNGNAIVFNDFGGGDPEIRNESTATHVINLNITGDSAQWLQIGAESGGLTFGGTINNNGSNIRMYSDNGHAVTFNGIISGGGGLLVDANTVVNLNAANTYSGATTINEGSIVLGSDNRISDSSALVIGASGTFNMNGNDETVASMSLASGGAVQLGAGQLIVNDASGTWAGTVAGSAGGSVVKKGSGTVSITADNSSMAGDWYVVGGTAGFNNNNAAGSGIIYLGEVSGSDAATIDISQTGVNVDNNIVVRSGSSGFKTINVGGAANASVEFSGDVTLNALVRLEAGSGETLTLSGTVGGAGQVSKIGAGTVILSGQNTYAGNTAVDAGTLVVSGDINNNGLFLGLTAGADAATL